MEMDHHINAHQHQLGRRLLYSIRFVDCFLKMTGIYLMVPSNTGNNNYFLVKRWIWSGCWIFVSVESGLYIFIFRGLRAIVQTIYSTGYRMMAENFNNSLIRISSFFFEMPIHLFLVYLTNRSTFQNLLETLEPIDYRLGRPNVTSIQYYSIACLVCTTCLRVYYDTNYCFEI